MLDSECFVSIYQKTTSKGQRREEGGRKEKQTREKTGKKEIKREDRGRDMKEATNTGGQLRVWNYYYQLPPSIFMITLSGMN